MESAWPRTIAASWAESLRAGSGRRTLPPTTPGRSAANATSSSPLRAIARRHPVTARLNGSVGDSRLGVLGLKFEDILERLAQPASGIAGRKIIQLAELSVAELLVETRRLKAEGVDVGILDAAFSGFFLGR